jgi:hypothetical protein
MVRGSSSVGGGGGDFPPLSRPAHEASCTMGTGSFPGVKSGRDVTLTPHPLLVPWSRKSRAIPLLSLWAVRPEQSLSAFTRVHFTLMHVGWVVKGKGKAIPLQTWTCPEVSKRLRLPIFQDSRHMKVVRLSTIRTGRLYPQEILPVVVCVRG